MIFSLQCLLIYDRRGSRHNLIVFFPSLLKSVVIYGIFIFLSILFLLSLTRALQAVSPCPVSTAVGVFLSEGLSGAPSNSAASM